MTHGSDNRTPRDRLPLTYPYYLHASQALLSQSLPPSQILSEQETSSSLLLSIFRLHLLSHHDVEIAAIFIHAHGSSAKIAECLPDYLLDSISTMNAELTCRKDMLEIAKDDHPNLSIDDGPHIIDLSSARSRLAKIVSQLVQENVLTEAQVCERLESSLLDPLGYVSSEGYMDKRTVQLRTARFFKQKTFNLLREENEGYTALATEILSNVGPATLPSYLEQRGQAPCQTFLYPADSMLTVIEQESPEKRNHRALRVIKNIQALIGYFSLDANRVLDIILDLFASNSTRHYPFFIALISASPWGRDQDLPDAVITVKDRPSGADLDLSEDTGNRICAQLLGFKMAHYCHADTKESESEDLYFTAALLIKNGLVRFADLYTHLSPGHEAMQKLHTQHRQALAAKVSSARSNALSMAAPLAEEGDTSATKSKAPSTSAEIPLKDPPNQIVGLLRAMLALGDIRHSVFILTRYPWLCAAYNEVADSFIRLLKVIVKPAYNDVILACTHPATSHPSLTNPKLRWDAKRQETSMPAPRSLFVTRRAPEPLPSASSQLVFFYSDWHADLPLCRTLPDVLDIFRPLLRILGVCLWRDPALLQQICRLTKVGLRAAVLSQDSMAKQNWLNVLRYHLLPALSLSASNSGILGEIWTLIRILPYEERFSLYGQWKNDLYQLPELRAAQAETEKEAKGILKRISKDNLKQSGRNLAKASHSNPTIFFTVALHQVQAYDNLIQPLVESAKYLSKFEYDIFAFNLVDALSNPEKERTKQDGTNISLWLKSLASFCGTLFRRYVLMDCVPVLQYLVNQLKANNSKDLVIVSELITKMSGIEPLANLADSQVAALTGGRILHMEAMMAANALTGSKERMAFRRSGLRLLNALSESRLAVPLLILVAQQRQACIHLVPESEAHLKYLGNLYDSCQEVLLQYIEFLYNHLETSEYAATVPSLGELAVRFGIDPAIAFYIARPKLVHSMKQVDTAEAAGRLRAELTAGTDRSKDVVRASSDDDVVMTSDLEVKPGLSEGASHSADVDMTSAQDLQAVSPDLTDAVASEDLINEASAIPEDVNAQGPEDVQITSPASPWHPGLADAIEAASKMLPEEGHSSLGVHFYVTFWQISLADLSVPIERYQQEIKRLNSLIRETPPEEGAKRLQDTIDKLGAELKDQMKSHKGTRQRLIAERNHWFSGSADRTVIVKHLIQYCLFPRALLSPTDAIFAGKFLRTMHGLGAKNFSTLSAYDRLFVDHVSGVIFSSTENEARNYSRFLHTILSDLSSWHASAEVYAKEGIGQGLPGFRLRWQVHPADNEAPLADFLTWETYRVLYCKWQACLQKSFCACLMSKEYMRIRNAIVIMQRIAPFYPVLKTHGSEMMTILGNLGSNELRGDLKILAQGMLATLKARQKAWMPLHKARTVSPNPAADVPPADLCSPVAVDEHERNSKTSNSTEKSDNHTIAVSESSDDEIKLVGIKLHSAGSNFPVEELGGPENDKLDAIAAVTDAPSPISLVSDRNSSTKPPPEANLPSRPVFQSRKSAANEFRRTSGTPSATYDAGASQRDPDALKSAPSIITDKVATRRQNRESAANFAHSASMSRQPNLPPRPAQTTREVPSGVGRNGRDHDRSTPVTNDADRRTGQERSPPTRQAREAVSDSTNSRAASLTLSGGAVSRSNADRGLPQRVASARDDSPRVGKAVAPTREAMEHAISVPNPPLRDSEQTLRDQDRRLRERADGDRTAPRERSQVGESSLADERSRPRPRDIDDRRDDSSHRQERESDRARYSDRRGMDRDDRRRRSARSSRNATPVPEATSNDRGSGSSTPLRTHRERDRDALSSRQDRERGVPASRSNPSEDDKGDTRKRTLVDRLTTGRDGPSDEDPSKRIRLHQSQERSDSNDVTKIVNRPLHSSRPLVNDETRPPNSPLPSRSDDGRLPYSSRSSLTDAQSSSHASRPHRADDGRSTYSSRTSDADATRFPHASGPQRIDKGRPPYSSRPSAPDATRSPYSSTPSKVTQGRPSYSSRPSGHDDARPQYSSGPPRSDEGRLAQSSQPPRTKDSRYAPQNYVSQGQGHGQGDRDKRERQGYRRDRTARRAGNE